jgi:lipocalin
MNGCFNSFLCQVLIILLSNVDLERYTGTWCEIANYHTLFQKDCIGTKATYSLRDDRDIHVLTSGIKKVPMET